MNLLPAFGLGIVTGVRSMVGLASFSDRAPRASAKENPVVRLLQRPEASPVLKLLAAGEVVMDKTPFLPARTEALPLAGRLAMGAVIGAAVSKDRWLQGGAAGAAGALLGAYAAYHLRKRLHDDAHIPQMVLGIVEDAVVVTTANALVEQVVAPA